MYSGVRLDQAISLQTLFIIRGYAMIVENAQFHSGGWTSAPHDPNCELLPSSTIHHLYRPVRASTNPAVLNALGNPETRANSKTSI